MSNKSSIAHARLSILENSVQAATMLARSKEAANFYCIPLVWSCKQVFLPNLFWFQFGKWICLDSALVLQLSRQEPFQGSTIRQRLPSEPELFQVEQVSPVTADNEFNAEPTETEFTLIPYAHAHLGKTFSRKMAHRIMQKIDNTFHWIHHYLVGDNVFLLDSGLTWG